MFAPSRRRDRVITAFADSSARGKWGFMGIDNTVDEAIDPLEALLSSGEIDDSTDVTEIAARLNGTATKPDEKDETDDVGAGKQPDQAAKPDDAQAAKPDLPEAKDDSDAAGKPFDKNDPLYGVLTGTRKALKEAQRIAEEQQSENATLRAQMQELMAKVNAGAKDSADAVQRAADKAGLTDDRGNAVDVATIDVDALREVYDGPIVDAIAALQAANQQQAAVIKDLRAKDVVREKTAEEIRAEAAQRDIDAVPVLAEWQASNPRLWAAAIAVEESLLEDPEWQGKSRIERFREVARTLGGDIKPAESKPDVTQTAKALKAAAGRAAPISLSELPSGTAAGQSESETLSDLSIEQLAEKMQGMSAAQQEQFLARLG